MDVYNGRMYYPEQHIIIWRISFFSLFSFLYSIRAGYVIHSLVPGTIFLTSLNHWRDPIYYSWRRKFDITCVRTALVYLLIIAYKSQYYKYFYTLIILSVSCYPVSNYCDKKKLYWFSIYIHCMLHILANIAILILFSGHIVPIHSNEIILYFIS